MPILLASAGTETGYDMIDVTPSGSDIDLTDPNGPTGGLCARALYIEGEGDVSFEAVGAPGGTGTTPPATGTRTVAVPNNFLLQVQVQKIVDATTDATGIWAIL